MNFYFLLTESCNLKCKHCIRGDSIKSFVSYEDAIFVIDSIYQYDSNATLIFSGGEPTIHKDFTKILSYALNLFPRVVLNSNGTTKFYSEKLFEIDLKKLIIQFSLDGDEKLHDFIRGYGSFKKTINNIKFINKLQKPIWISTVVTKENFESIKKLPSILKDFNIKQWHVSPVMPFGNGKNVKDISIDEWNKLVDEIINITPFRLSIRKLFNFDSLEKLSNSELNCISHNSRCIENKNCGCGTKKIYI